MRTAAKQSFDVRALQAFDPQLPVAVQPELIG